MSPAGVGELPIAVPVTVITIAQERTIIPSSKLARYAKLWKTYRKLIDTAGLFNI
jgi:hypothetical protein